MKGQDDHRVTGLKSNWPLSEELPIQSANVFSVLNSPEERTFYLTIGSAVPLLVDAEQRRRILQEGVTVLPLIRVAISEPKMVELIAALRQNYDRYTNAITSEAKEDINGQ